jgi:DNA repair ATPase RecN
MLTTYKSYIRVKVANLEIKEINIEGGFLNGFNLKFSHGLNVLMGARGTGKTSVIELIRYALNSKSWTDESRAASLKHARGVLGDGEVCIFLSDEISDVTVRRSYVDAHPSSSGPYSPPIVLSQTEIENIGLDQKARLKVVDGFIDRRDDYVSKRAEITNSLSSILKEINSLEKSVLDEQISDENEIKISLEISSLVAEQEKFSVQSQEFAQKATQLNELNEQQSAILEQRFALDSFSKTLMSWHSYIDEKMSLDFGVDEWHRDNREDPLDEFRGEYIAIVERLADQMNSIAALNERVKGKAEKILSEQPLIDTRLRSLKNEFEAFQEGAGKISQRLSYLNNEKTKIALAKNSISEKLSKIRLLKIKRDEQFNELTNLAVKRSNERVDVARSLNQKLKPSVRVDVECAVDIDEYCQALISALRGSGLKYNELAASLAERVSPKELMQFIDKDDFAGLADVAAIPRERAWKVIAHLKEVGYASIITAEIGDNVKLCLLDGHDYKPTTQLSAGQRCTVVLSIILQHTDRILVIDQPEDHLDNAFIASTVIKALHDRSSAGQVILSTHNPNIPILGNAQLVVEMSSDGRNGFIETAEGLTHSKSVDSIARVMEGGNDAFNRRADFYSENSL